MDATVQFAFTRGLDTKTDKHSRLPGGADLVINGSFDKLGAINKRHGNVSEGNACVGGNGPPFPLVGPSTLPATPFGMFAFGQEQVTLANKRLYSYTPGRAGHVSRDYVPEAIATRRPLQNLAWFNQYVNPDCIVCNGFEVWVWSTGGINPFILSSVYEIATGALVLSSFVPNTIIAGAALPKLVAPTSTLVVLCWADASNNIFAQTLDT